MIYFKLFFFYLDYFTSEVYKQNFHILKSVIFLSVFEVFKGVLILIRNNFPVNIFRENLSLFYAKKTFN